MFARGILILFLAFTIVSAQPKSSPTRFIGKWKVEGSSKQSWLVRDILRIAYVPKKKASLGVFDFTYKRDGKVGSGSLVFELRVQREAEPTIYRARLLSNGTEEVGYETWVLLDDKTMVVKDRNQEGPEAVSTWIRQ
jgi:hypothetical protein